MTGHEALPILLDGHGLPRCYSSRPRHQPPLASMSHARLNAHYAEERIARSCGHPHLGASAISPAINAPPPVRVMPCIHDSPQFGGVLSLVSCRVVIPRRSAKAFANLLGGHRNRARRRRVMSRPRMPRSARRPSGKPRHVHLDLLGGAIADRHREPFCDCMTA